MENSYFVAPKALGFIFMALAVRGAFNFHPLNLIKLKFLFQLVKILSCGLIAMSCGLDDSPKYFAGMFQQVFAGLFAT